MKYPIYNPTAYRLLSFCDGVLEYFFRRKKMAILPPRSILISQIGHLGDVILTTSLLKPLKEAFPGLQIGILTGSWSKKVIEKHPLIDRFHFFDHWKNNRSRNKTFLKHWKTRNQALWEIKKAGYDIAIDCSFHFPNAAPLLWQAKIPARIGFESAGLSAFLTHSLPWQPENRSAVESYFSLVKLFLKKKNFPFQPHLPLPPPSLEKNGIVIHLGSGNQMKEWPLEKWRKLARMLSDQRLLFTGEGEREISMIEKVIEGLPHCVNLAGHLTWEQFTALIKEAALIISVDSSAGHIAAAYNTPLITLFTGMHPFKLWKPSGDHTYQLSNPVSCSPCFRGCKAMSCIRDIRVEWVYAAAKNILSPKVN